jgi:hypothetical protein
MMTGKEQMKYELVIVEEDQMLSISMNFPICRVSFLHLVIGDEAKSFNDITDP